MDRAEFFNSIESKIAALNASKRAAQEYVLTNRQFAVATLQLLKPLLKQYQQKLQSLGVQSNVLSGEEALSLQAYWADSQSRIFTIACSNEGPLVVDVISGESLRSGYGFGEKAVFDRDTYNASLVEDKLQDFVGRFLDEALEHGGL